MILLLAAMVRLHRLDALSFWLDEAATLRFAKGPPWDIWGSDTHPPLYYTLISAWRLLGESEYALRLSSVLLSLGTVVLLYRAGRVLGGPLAGLLAALLLALSPISIVYAQELRMYALLELCVALALLGFARIARENRGWWLYGLGSVAALYTHNMAVLWPLAANAAVLPLLIGRPERGAFLRRWLLVNLAVLLCWMLYWPALFAQVERVVGDFWLQQPAPPQALGAVGYIFFGLGPRFDGLELALLPVMLAVALVGLAALGDRRLAVSLLLLALLAPLISYGLVLVARPLFYARTLLWIGLPIQLALGLGLAWALGGAAARRPPWGLLALGCVVAFLALRGGLVSNSYDRVVKADWRGLTWMISEQSLPNDRLLVTPWFEQDSLDYYAARLAASGLPALPPHLGIGERQAEAVIAETLAELPPGGRLWVVRSLRYREVLDPLPLLLAARPCLVSQRRLEAVGLEAHLLGQEEDCPP